MWADSLQALERAHLLRLLAWGAASVLAGTTILAWLRTGHRESTLVKQFAYQCAGWGLVDAAVGGLLLANLAPRDLAAATRLDRLLWLNIGLDAGYLLVGTTLIVGGWRLGRRLGAVGAGIGVIVQGLALGLLDLMLAAQVSR